MRNYIVVVFLFFCGLSFAQSVQVGSAIDMEKREVFCGLRRLGGKEAFGIFRNGGGIYYKPFNFEALNFGLPDSNWHNAAGLVKFGAHKMGLFYRLLSKNNSFKIWLKDSNGVVKPVFDSVKVHPERIGRVGVLTSPNERFTFLYLINDYEHPYIPGADWLMGSVGNSLHGVLWDSLGQEVFKGQIDLPMIKITASNVLRDLAVSNKGELLVMSDLHHNEISQNGPLYNPLMYVFRFDKDKKVETSFLRLPLLEDYCSSTKIIPCQSGDLAIFGLWSKTSHNVVDGLYYLLIDDKIKSMKVLEKYSFSSIIKNEYSSVAPDIYKVNYNPKLKKWSIGIESQVVNGRGALEYGPICVSNFDLDGKQQLFYFIDKFQLVENYDKVPFLSYAFLYNDKKCTVLHNDGFKLNKSNILAYAFGYNNPKIEKINLKTKGLDGFKIQNAFSYTLKEGKYLLFGNDSKNNNLFPIVIDINSEK
jgi:hypothetical protein